MMNRKMVKIICIVMAGLMILSACAVLLQVFATGEKEVVASTVTPETGDGLSDYVIPAGVAVLAVPLLLAVGCRAGVDLMKYIGFFI